MEAHYLLRLSPRRYDGVSLRAISTMFPGANRLRSRPDFEGVTVSDFFSAYSPLEVEKAKCWAHLLRDSHDLAAGKPPDSEYVHFHREVHGLFLEVITLSAKADSFSGHALPIGTRFVLKARSEP